jgi:hypothetical protein
MYGGSLPEPPSCPAGAAIGGRLTVVTISPVIAGQILTTVIRGGEFITAPGSMR